MSRARVAVLSVITKQMSVAAAAAEYGYSRRQLHRLLARYRDDGLAGLWNTWTDKATGEVLESYTMLTINADAHPLMSRMHKPDPKLAADKQDKRSVIPLEPADYDQWLAGTQAEAAALLRLLPVELFDAGPAGQQE